MTLPLHPATRQFLQFFSSNPQVRAKIAARRDKTLVYAGDWSTPIRQSPIWQELERMRQAAKLDFDLLPDVLKTIPAPNGLGPNLLEYVNHLVRTYNLPWKNDEFVIWRVLSGIYAKNAQGMVYAFIGKNLGLEKVFVATEINVLTRNFNIDPISADFFREMQTKLRALKKTNPHFDLDFAYIPLPPRMAR